jgi:hypothetical protein
LSVQFCGFEPIQAIAVTPVRLRLSRVRGFDLQAHSRAVNGLPAVNCARPGKWGNGFRWQQIGRERAVAKHAASIRLAVQKWPSVREAMEELRGKNLACWCRLDEACHCDTLLELANG